MGYAVMANTEAGGMVSGTVQSCNGDHLLVWGPGGLVRALRAEGCLLVPATGDTVLVAMTASGEAWVISVLRRKRETAELRLPEHTVMHARQLGIQAEHASLEAAVLQMRGQEVRLEGKSMVLHSRLLSLGGKVLLQGFTVVQTFARRLGERVFRRHGRYAALQEEVGDLAELKAGRVRMESRTSYRVRAENADVRASAQLDLDASHIKVG